MKESVCEKVSEEIEILRNKMIKIAAEHGLQHPIVLQYSRQIDEMHNLMLRRAK